MVEFNTFLLESYANGQNTYMCGDFNLDLLRYIMYSLMRITLIMFYLSGYIPTITLRTRLFDTSTLIDNIFTFNLSSDIMWEEGIATKPQVYLQ